MQLTDPTGCCFLSYKRERSDEAQLIVEACLDRGIPVWQDISDLKHGVTEAELERVLSDPTTSSALIFITPEVEHSHVIREVEVPNIFHRVREKDEFFCVPIAAGKLNYDEAASVLGKNVGITSLPNFNILKTDSDPIDEEQAAKIAKTVLEHRIVSIAQKIPPLTSVNIQISTRSPLTKTKGTVLQLDYSNRFSGRAAKSGTWESLIEPALDDVVKVLTKHMGHNEFLLGGTPTLPAAVAIGSKFLSVSGIRANWEQNQIGSSKEPELWGLQLPRAESGYIADVEPYSASGTDLALLVSINSNVINDFRLSSDILPLRAAVHISLPDKNQSLSSWLSSGEALDIATIAVNALREARNKYRTHGTMHLFLAVPAGIAFMIGQLLNTFGIVQTYDYIPEQQTPYTPAILLHPSK